MSPPPVRSGFHIAHDAFAGFLVGALFVQVWTLLAGHTPPYVVAVLGPLCILGAASGLRMRRARRQVEQLTERYNRPTQDEREGEN